MSDFTKEERQLLIDSVSYDTAVSGPALSKIATALELPLRKGVQAGDIISGIFERIDAPNGRSSVEFPLHYMEPGTEGDYVAYTVPTFGSIPQKLISGDYVNVPVIDIAASIDWDNRYAKDARWDVVSDAQENLRAQMTKKINDLGWHTLISAAYDRGMIVADSDASRGQFTPRLVSLMKTVMRRNGGGNSSSVNRSVLTDLYISPEAVEDMRSWNVDVIDEVTRREIFTSGEGALNRIFQVNMHDLDELGEGQEYQLFFEDTLGATLPTTNGHVDVEMVVGINQSSNRSFVMPVAEDITVIPDNTRIRHRQTGWIALASMGFAVLDARDVMVGSF